MFIILSGVSGSGKQTVIGEIIKNHKDCKFVKSATTRPVRKGEEDLHYHLSEEEFLKKEKNGEFFETALVHGYHYGILNKSLDEIIENPDRLFIKDVDVLGTENLLKKMSDKIDFLCVFLEVPDPILYERLIKRGESPERAKIRIERGSQEREYKHLYHYCIDNIELDKTVKKLENMIKKKLKNKN